MEKIYRLERKCPIDIYNRMPFSRLQKEFILNFLCDIPLEDLVKLVGFEEIHPYDSKLPDDDESLRLIKELRYKNSVLFKCSIGIDDGMNPEKPIRYTYKKEE